MLKALLRIVGLIGLASPQLAQTVSQNKAVLSGNNEQVETTMAINPTNPQNLVGGAITFSGNQQQLGVYYSTNSGATWSGNDLFTSLGSGEAASQ